MATSPVERVLQRARGYIGQHEQPMGSNTGPFVLACQRSTSLGGTRWPWCGAFCDRVFTEEGVPFPASAPTASAFGMYAWAKKVGWTISKPKPGALAVVNAGAGHICIVESYDPETGTVTSIDGNVSDSVARRRRHIGEFRGFIWNPVLSKTKPAPPKTRTPWWMVVTSESGHAKVVYRGPLAKTLEHLPGILARTANGVTIRQGKK